MVESTAVSCIHPDKYNNSVDRIISKQEEREDPRRDTSVFFEYSGVPHSTRISSNTVYSYKNYKNYSVSTRNPATPSNSTYRINSSLRNTTTTRLIPCRLLPATVRRVSKHSTRQNKAPGFPTAFQGHTAQAGFQLILPGRNSILSSRQHPRSPYSNSQAESNPLSTTRIHLVLQNSTRRNRILSKGLSIVYPIQY